MSSLSSVSAGSKQAYAVAGVLVLLATVLRWLLGWIDAGVLVFPTFYPAVLFATLIGGAGPGLFAAGLSTLLPWYLFVPPPGAFFPLTLGQAIDLGLFFASSLVIIWATERHRKTTARLQQEEKHRQLVVNELAHRLKNKGATIQSILYHQFRDNPAVRDQVMGRLQAISATDDLVMAAHGQGADLRAILLAELGPYGAVRVSLGGPDVLLLPKLALTMALLFHELATNAAKYGALSGPEGTLSVRWSLAGQQLTVDWAEHGGPAVAAPVTRGFGTRLMAGALDPFDGSVDLQFNPDGLACKMVAAVPTAVPHGSSQMVMDAMREVLSHRRASAT
jgi:two-component sensor histidine kinase